MSDTLISKSPAAWHRDLWREAFPSGNGRIGMLVYGHVADETVIINHSGLWHHSQKMEVPQLTGALKRTRELIDGGDYWNANWIITNELREKGFSASLGSPFPALRPAHSDEYFRQFPSLPADASYGHRGDGGMLEGRK